MNSQQLRHSSPSRLLRRGLSRYLVGPVWPLRFRSSPTTTRFAEEAATNLYFHLPFCRTLCAYCPYLEVRHEPVLAANYTNALLDETRSWLAASPHQPLESVYFGGGTPFLLLPAIERLLALLAPRLHAATGLGIELHPADVSVESARRLHALGFDRVSLGAESLHAATLRQLGRAATPAQITSAAAILRAAGFRCVDTNLIYGIDGQTTEDLLADAAHLIDLGVHQISAYPLLPFRHTRCNTLANLRNLVSRDRTARKLRTLCLARGLRPTSVWSFNRPGSPAYTTVTLDTFRGFGAGAATRTLDGFRFNTFDVAAYAQPGGQRTALTLDADARFHRAHWLYWKIYQLHVPSAAYRTHFGTTPELDFPQLFGWLSRLGFAQNEGGDWVINHRGADWIHRVQQLYSRSWIDLFWSRCMHEAWPTEVILE